MKPLAECAPCILEWTFGRTAHHLSETQRIQLMNTLLGVLHDEFRVDRNVALIAKQTLDAVQPGVLAARAVYDPIKKASNDAAKILLPHARGFVQKGKTPKERFETIFYQIFLVSATIFDTFQGSIFGCRYKIPKSQLFTQMCQ